MQLIIEINQYLTIKRWLKAISKSELIDGYLIGIKNLSLDAPKMFSLEEAKLFIDEIHHLNKHVYLNVMRLFHQEALTKAIEIINKLNLNKDDFIIFGDIGLFMLLHDKYKMIYYAPTYLTNTKDVALYQNICYNVIVSNQVSKDELIKITNYVPNTIIELFGQEAIFYSRRPLLTNYFIHTEKKNNPLHLNYYVQEELRSDLHPVIEDEAGFHLYECKHYYLLEELPKLTSPNKGLIRTIFLDKTSTIKIIQIYNDYFMNYITMSEAQNCLSKMAIETYKGSYDMKTILLKKETIN